MLGVVGIEIPIDRLEGKLKASQDEDMQDRLGTAGGLRRETCSDAASMADLVMGAIDLDAAGRT
jgi:transcriptional regulator